MERPRTIPESEESTTNSGDSERSVHPGKPYLSICLVDFSVVIKSTLFVLVSGDLRRSYHLYTIRIKENFLQANKIPEILKSFMNLKPALCGLLLTTTTKLKFTHENIKIYTFSRNKLVCFHLVHLCCGRSLLLTINSSFFAPF